MNRLVSGTMPVRAHANRKVIARKQGEAIEATNGMAPLVCPNDTWWAR
jgi:hypothetical protein